VTTTTTMTGGRTRTASSLRRVCKHHRVSIVISIGPCYHLAQHLPYIYSFPSLAHLWRKFYFTNCGNDLFFKSCPELINGLHARSALPQPAGSQHTQHTAFWFSDGMQAYAVSVNFFHRPSKFDLLAWYAWGSCKAQPMLFCRSGFPYKPHSPHTYRPRHHTHRPRHHTRAVETFGCRLYGSNTARPAPV